MSHYGIKNQQHAIDIAVDVVTVMGGSINAVALLVETCCAETLLGMYPDKTPTSHGVGANQHDHINLVDIKKNSKRKHLKRIKRQFGIDIKKVQLADLAENPRLSFICCRLSYLRIPAPIPETVEERGQYWKDYYNRSGEGTPEKYVERVKECLGEDWLGRRITMSLHKP